MNSAIALKVCVITAAVRRYKSIIKKKKKKHNKIVLLAKAKLNSIEVIISKVLIDSNIINDETVLINNVLKKYCDTREEIKNSNDKQKSNIYIYIYIEKKSKIHCLKCKKNTESKNPRAKNTKNGRIILLAKRAVCVSKN